MNNVNGISSNTQLSSVIDNAKIDAGSDELSTFDRLRGSSISDRPDRTSPPPQHETSSGNGSTADNDSSNTAGVPAFDCTTVWSPIVVRPPHIYTDAGVSDWNSDTLLINESTADNFPIKDERPNSILTSSLHTITSILQSYPGALNGGGCMQGFVSGGSCASDDGFADPMITARSESD